MPTQRFPKQRFRRQLGAIEDELRQWAYDYAHLAEDEPVDWKHDRLIVRYEQLLDVAHTVERASADLDVLPRIS